MLTVIKSWFGVGANLVPFAARSYFCDPYYAPQKHRDIIVVELAKQDCSKLPWKFGAKYLLRDPEGKVVEQWSRSRVALQDDFEQTFLVKIGAKDPGIYTYTVDVVVRSGFGTPKRFPLVREPRTVFFFGAVDQAKLNKFWRELRKVLPRGNGDMLAAPGSSSPAIAQPSPAKIETAPTSPKDVPAKPPSERSREPDAKQ